MKTEPGTAPTLREIEAARERIAGIAQVESAIGITMSLLVGVVIAIFVVLRRRGWEI